MEAVATYLSALANACVFLELPWLKLDGKPAIFDGL